MKGLLRAMALSTLLANTGDPTAAGAAGSVVAYTGADAAAGVVGDTNCGGGGGVGGKGEGYGDAGRLMAGAHSASADSCGTGA